MQLSNHLFTYQDDDLNHFHPHAFDLRSKQRLGLPNPTEQMLCLPLLRSSSALRHLQRDRYQRRIRGMKEVARVTYTQDEYQHGNVVMRVRNALPHS